MAKRERRKPVPGEFEDPLSNYDPQQFEDELERSLVEDSVTSIPHEDYLKLPASATVSDALEAMSEANDACVVVVDDDGKAVGIFSERDVLTRVACEGGDFHDKPLSDVMTAEPVVVHSDESPARVLNIMVTGGFRHMPVLDESDRVIGMIGARRLTAYLQNFFPDAEAK